MKPEMTDAKGFVAVDNGGSGYVSRLRESIKTGLIKGAFHIAYIGAEIAEKIEQAKEKRQAKEKGPIGKMAACLTEFMGKDMYR